MYDDMPRRNRPRAVPVTLTFYDTLGDYPFMTTVFVREDEPAEAVGPLVEAIRAVSTCVLASYKIGSREYPVPGYERRVKDLDPSVVGWQKWVVKYRTARGSARLLAIPGRDPALELNTGDAPVDSQGRKPDPDHPKWQTLARLFKQMCVAKDGDDLQDWIELYYRNEVWPPREAKRR